MERSIPCAMPLEDVYPLYNFMSKCSRTFKQFCILSAALDLKLFDLIDERQTPERLSEIIGADRSMIEDMCEILSHLGFLEKVTQGYRNTPISRSFLRGASLWNQGEVIKNLQAGFGLWERLTQICRDGPVNMNDDELFAKNNFIDSLQAEILTGELQKTVSIISDLPEFTSAEKLLDLGGGHGLYAIAFSTLNPGLRAFIFDLPGLEQSARAMMQRFHATNVQFVPGNMYKDDYGKEYDVVFFSYSPGGRSPYILQKIHGCLKTGGLFVTKHAFYANEEGSKSRLLDLEWKLTAMKGIQKDKRIYSFVGDLSLEGYKALLEQKFTILKIAEAPEFGRPELSKFGDTLDSIIIVAKKKHS
ncbi:methyltransferase family protein [Desulfomonile tiedjei]|uniref:Precorrin-6B methylase 2 n=1 Tax=Desulfomonile tiedjei (strain ATCC 49306 / DSM 6799 / DCB-1) TaxID=706587 RepID=I4C0A9_DESTA|nr:methyltransferase [Desulfomonile tiedjei]AFM23000.1 precorrin-6B methylase 2 [Desulfomonile tiedjei DSM 6799]